jgi:hypothetical protein
LSDLANSCEYLTNEKLCQAVSESEKAKAARQVRCRNEEKMTCCYLCMLVLDCATPCRFLGNNENAPQQIDVENTNINNPAVSDEKLEGNKTENSPAICCSLCNIEMSKARTKIRIDGLEGSNQKSTESNMELAAIVYLCPKCGKIDFRADEKPTRNK